MFSVTQPIRLPNSGNPHAGDNHSEKINHVVPLQSDVVAGKYGNLQQDVYAKKMQGACLEIVTAIRDEKKSFKEIRSITGMLRQAIANDSNTPFSDKFGLLRTSSFSHRISTPLREEYGSMIERLLEIDEKDPSMEWEMYSRKEEGSIRSGFRIGFCHDGSTVQLSKYFFSTAARDEKMNTIAHAYPEVLEKAFQECEFLYNEILRFDRKTQFSLIHEYLAKFHWWFDQATFYFRGSAACGELIVSALALIQLGSSLKWKSGVYVDRIALTTSEKEFVSIYSSLHEKLVSNNG
jgi:hypothetical protein